MISLIEETKKSCSSSQMHVVSSQMHVVVAQRRSKRISISRNGNNDDDGDDTLANKIFLMYTFPFLLPHTCPQ